MLTTNEKRWVLMKPDENGNPLQWLSETELAELLADPTAWGVDLFLHLDDMRGGTDPNYWSHGTGVLLRVEIVVPERGGWRLPGQDKLRSVGEPEADGRWVSGSGPLTLKDVVG